MTIAARFLVHESESRAGQLHDQFPGLNHGHRNQPPSELAATAAEHKQAH